MLSRVYCSVYRGMRSSQLCQLLNHPIQPCCTFSNQVIYNIKREQREKSLEKPGLSGENLLQVKSLFYYAFCSASLSVLYVFLCVVVVVEPDFNVRRFVSSISPGLARQRPSQYMASMCTNLSTSTRRAAYFNIAHWSATLI